VIIVNNFFSISFYKIIQCKKMQTQEGSVHEADKERKPIPTRTILSKWQQSVQQFQHEHEKQVPHEKITITLYKASESPFLKWDQEISKQRPPENRMSAKFKIKPKTQSPPQTTQISTDTTSPTKNILSLNRDRFGQSFHKFTLRRREELHWIPY
jgi:hypothetical protein